MTDDDEVSSCRCGAALCICNPFEDGDEEPNAYRGATWAFGRCVGGCGRQTSVAVTSRVCHECSRRELRAYFASDEAKENAARILGTPMPARRKAAA